MVLNVWHMIYLPMSNERYLVEFENFSILKFNSKNCWKWSIFRHLKVFNRSIQWKSLFWPMRHNLKEEILIQMIIIFMIISVQSLKMEFNLKISSFLAQIHRKLFHSFVSNFLYKNCNCFRWRCSRRSHGKMFIWSKTKNGTPFIFSWKLLQHDSWKIAHILFALVFKFVFLPSVRPSVRFALPSRKERLQIHWLQSPARNQIQNQFIFQYIL